MKLNCGLSHLSKETFKMSEDIKGQKDAPLAVNLQRGIRRCAGCKDSDSKTIMSFVLRCRNCQHWNKETIRLLSGLIGKKKYIHAYCNKPDGKFKDKLMEDWHFCDSFELSA